MNDPGPPLCCARCGYCLRGHEKQPAVTCPECGRTSLYGELAVPVTRATLHGWSIPLFGVPAALAAAWPDAPSLRFEDGAAAPLLVIAALFAVSYAGARGCWRDRLCTAAALTPVLWMTTGLVTRAAAMLS